MPISNPNARWQQQEHHKHHQDPEPQRHFNPRASSHDPRYSSRDSRSPSNDSRAPTHDPWMRRDPAIQPSSRMPREIDHWERGRPDQPGPRPNPRIIPADNRPSPGHDRFRDNRLDNRFVFCLNKLVRRDLKSLHLWILNCQKEVGLQMCPDFKWDLKSGNLTLWNKNKSITGLSALF